MLLADLTSWRGPSHRPEQLIADPELKQPCGDQDVAGAAAEVLADADVLRVDAHDAVGCHSARDPVLSIALGRWRKLARAVLTTPKPALRSRVLERLVRPLSVVVAHPLIQRLLCCLQISEHLPRVELDSEATVKAFDLAGSGRRARLGEDVVDTILPADAVEQDFDWGLGEASGEDLAVVGQNLGRHPVLAQRRAEAVAH